MPHSILRARVYPSRDTTVGFMPREKKAKAEKEYDAAAPRQVKHTIVDPITEEVTTYMEIDAPPPSSHIGSSLPSNLRSQRKVVKGRKGLTANGKRMVRSAVTLMKALWTNKRLGFYTFTLPGLDVGKLFDACYHWSKVNQRLREEIKRELERVGAPTNIVLVTEIQLKRWEERGEVAPHLHVVFCAHAGDWKWYISANKLREIWRRVLTNVLGYEVESVNAAVDAQSIKKDVVRYLGKYLSKGAEICKEIVEAGCGDCLPRHWWSMDAVTRKMVKDAIIEDTGPVAEWLSDNATTLVEDGFADFFNQVTIPERSQTKDRVESDEGRPAVKTSESKPGERIVGWCGRLNALGMQVVAALRSVPDLMAKKVWEPLSAREQALAVG